MRANQNANELWAAAAAKAGYAIHNGMPIIGISGEKTDTGFLVPVPAPDWFNAIADEGQRENVARGMLAHALRVSQGKLKAAEKNGTNADTLRTAATDGAASVVAGTYRPGRSSDNDILDSEASKLFRDRVAELVKAANPEATDAHVDVTVAEQLKTERGKEVFAEYRAQVAERGTYAVQRKATKANAPPAIAVTL